MAESQDKDIARDLTILVGQKAWGLSRSVGSCFFMEFGDVKKIYASKKRPNVVHGRWHFLFEECHWKFTGAHGLVVFSDNDQDSIDDTFEHLVLGVVQSAAVCPVTRSLKIAFDSGVVFETFSYGTESEDDSWQWIFFMPGFTWTMADNGEIIREQAN